jgi:hypothetical protein
MRKEAQQHFVLEASFMVKIFQVTISGWHGTSDYAVGSQFSGHEI